MAKLVFALNQSLDGYTDHMEFPPDPMLFRHFIRDVAGLSGAVYGRAMYEAMRYWDEDRPEWDEGMHEYAAGWRRMPKWVVSTTMTAVGPNATLVGADAVSAIGDVKRRMDGTLQVAGPKLAAGLAELVDEYQIYVHPVVLGRGTPLFAAKPPSLRLVGHDQVSDRVVRLTYVPA